MSSGPRGGCRVVGVWKRSPPLVHGVAFVSPLARCLDTQGQQHQYVEEQDSTGGQQTMWGTLPTPSPPLSFSPIYGGLDVALQFTIVVYYRHFTLTMAEYILPITTWPLFVLSGDVFGRAARPVPKALGGGPAPGAPAHDPPATVSAQHRRPARSARRGARTGSILRGYLRAPNRESLPISLGTCSSTHASTRTHRLQSRSAQSRTTRPAVSQPPSSSSAQLYALLAAVADCFDGSLRCPTPP